MLPFIFASLLGFIIIMYVILDGFDLGIGILFLFTQSERERDLMMNSIAPVWDGNETWLVFGGAMLYGAFPIVYGLLLPILYMPIMLMLIALIFRGVCFEFRFKAETSKPIWNWAFAMSSIMAAFMQGVILGAFVQGFNINEAALVISDSDWLTPFSLLTGIAVICGYALLGATWMIIKSEQSLQKKMIHLAKGFLIMVAIFLVFVSIWTPLHNEEIFNRWYSFPNVFLLMPLPVVTAVMVFLVWKNLSCGQEIKPFVYSIVIFFCSYVGIGISVYPYLIPHEITIWEAAAPNTTLIFILIGVVIMLPVLLGYTLYAYRVFGGKSAGEGYH
ncbi:cytochrome d ubiquinol oxidase subunit II [Legionella oakridgensis]|uniref:Cytochrome d oxidase, subunit II n=2 Tax=Legionella oakridgensis TaxID=29423 RepID=W0BG07_9GAMM|nr:cytochrome d ubiquinol oxidase subunit II [Legionella oakridgensis]AHE67364.1 cytochrome d oxidase, subunit II [Legionella oakridgensis ATCC 33761 = DSM 21215]ETO93027.1 cytochrome bd-I ubiquinol oxidase, subunit 2 apoprotein [Legionella oakridgensis RV-2-2007]KTD43434.1 cytochrome D ubiquinol oxidase subunit II, cyanide insensitive [Legionella oakridgensis]STY20425.1 cytochrome D ubiquinol oxidase subunit II, cyanide insensitive [Legionella longbeachae]